MNPPIIPPDRAFAVAGRVTAAVAEALAEARRIQAAWATALDQARAAGQAAAEAEGRARYRRGLRALHHWAARERTRLEGEARTLALALATRMVAAPRLPTEKTALPAPPPGGWLRLRLHPSDAQALGAGLTVRAAGQPQPPGTPPQGIEIIADPALAPGDLIAEGPAGRVDARASTRLRQLLAGAEP